MNKVHNRSNINKHEHPYFIETTLLIHTVSILLKYLVGLYGYSGKETYHHRRKCPT